MDGVIKSMIEAAMENANNLRVLGADATAAPIIDQTIHILEMLSLLALAVEEEDEATRVRLEDKWRVLHRQQYTLMPPSGMIC